MQHTTLCDKVCQWLATCRCFPLGTLVSSTNKNDHHDITVILLKVALNSINLNLFYVKVQLLIWFYSAEHFIFKMKNNAVYILGRVAFKYHPLQWFTKQWHSSTV